MAIARFRGNLVPAPKNAVVKIMQYLLHTKNWESRSVGLTVSDVGACLDIRRSVCGAVVMSAFKEAKGDGVR